MKNTSMRNVWDVLYPVLLYLVVSDCVYTLLSLAFGEGMVSEMALQIFTAVISSPSVFYIYYSDKRQRKAAREEKDSRESGKRKAGTRILHVVLICGAAVLLSVSLNNLISLTALKEQSEAYQRVNASFFSSNLWVELLGTSLLTPVLEEMLYRGIVYERLKRYGKMSFAVGMSAFIFGIMHFNLVQFLYAGIIGLFLAGVYEMEGTLLVPILSHAVANAVSVLRTELGLFGWLTQKNIFFVPISLIMLVISVIIIWYVKRPAT